MTLPLERSWSWSASDEFNLEILTFFHEGTLMTIIIGIMAAVCFIILALFHISGSSNYHSQTALLETYWVVIPAFLLLLIGLPSTHILYVLEEKSFSNNTSSVKTVGNQWFWTYFVPVNDSLGSLETWFSEFPQSNLGEGEDEFPHSPVYSLAPQQVDMYMLPSLSSDYSSLVRTGEDLVIEASTPFCNTVTSNDVMHSWALPAAGLKVDAIPGRLNALNLYFSQGAGSVLYGQCSELCGVNHSFIPIVVNVSSPSSLH